MQPPISNPTRVVLLLVDTDVGPLYNLIIQQVVGFYKEVNK